MCPGVCVELQTRPPCACVCHQTVELPKDEYDRHDLTSIAKAIFPHGHARFNELMLEMMKLHSDKNKGYAGCGEALGNFGRVAKIMDNYPSFPIMRPEGIVIMYMMKHLDRILWDLTRGVAPSDESLADIAVYMTILRCMNLDRNAEYAK